MKMITKSDIKFGQIYAAKISGRIVPVCITGKNKYCANHFDAENLRTKRNVIIRSGRKLRAWWDAGNHQWIQAQHFQSSFIK